MQLTNIIVGEKALYTNSPTVAKQLNEWVAKGNSQENFPGGVITDVDALLVNIKDMVEDNVTFEWRDAPKKKVTQGQLTVRSATPLDMTPYQELRTLSSGDQANVMFMSFFYNVKTLLTSDASAGSLVHAFQQMTNSLGMVINAKTVVNCNKMADNVAALVPKLDFESAVVHLHRKTVQYKIITTYQALIEFVAHEGMTAYYLSSGNYLLEVGDQTMEISRFGSVVRIDKGFDDELLKVGFRIQYMTDHEARAVLTLSKVLEVKRDGEEYIVSFSSAIPGVVNYPGFAEYSLMVGGPMKALFNPIIRTKGKVIGESGWYSYSVHVLALRKFFIEQLQGDMKYVVAVEAFLDDICSVDAQKLSEKLEPLLKYRRAMEKSVLGSLQNPLMCIEFCKKASAVLACFGVSGSGSLPYKEKGVTKTIKYPTFEENADRLKAGRFSRNSDPRKFLHKQYPIIEGGPAAIMGDATADKWERIFATLKSLLGSDVLSSFSQLIYAGVTNNDRMLGGICEAWVSSRKSKALEDLTLLDRNSPNSAKWNLKFGEHEFSVRSPQNPAGEFVVMDLIKFLDSMDSSGGKTSFLFSDCNVLSTDEENYHQQNEFAAEGIELGYEKLTSWIVNHKKATPNAVAAAKYIFKCASKFKAGVIKLHLFKVAPGFMEAVAAKLYEVCKLDSLLWKEGRGHNPEYYFYFFPEDVEAKTKWYQCAAWILPVLTSASAVSELTRHVSFYCPHRLEGYSTISHDGIFGHSSAFPVIFPSVAIRQYVDFEIGGKKYKAIKNIRVGTQSLVAGIANQVEGTIDLDALYIAIPPLPVETETSFIMTTPPVVDALTGHTVIKPVSRISTPDVFKGQKTLIPSNVVKFETIDVLDVSNLPDVEEEEEEEEEDVTVTDLDEEETKKEERLNSAFD